MKELTKAEDDLMQILWELQNAYVKDIIAKLPNPKPAYNTVSTIIRILEKKGFVGHEAFGKTHRYFPLISKEAYTNKFMKNFVERYFNNSYKQMVSFFAKENNLSINDLEEIQSLMESQLSKKKVVKNG